MSFEPGIEGEKVIDGIVFMIHVEHLPNFSLLMRNVLKYFRYNKFHIVLP